ncbi:rhomboid family intramembrane serine protease [Marinomonas ostreistagni]|uniref:Rhomboid family intramembrane serine protease n=1 Tax=Marinomonas ostreistagni TaxID=359209 RepID=A0ABS0ZGB6_9GAMM|nr:rhomboid family intramembrane serine protease [Marinomonas ostreistagni]MBJ7551946.1 rhomboid family intramembrane serine protease [Marinomonas ostreistagni]
MVLLYEFAVNESPESLSKILWQQRIGHRIVQSNSHDQLWVLDPSDTHQAMELLQLWQQSPTEEVELTNVTPRHKKPSSPIFQQWHKSPMALAFIVLSCLVAVITGLGDYLDTISWFTISSFEVIGNRIQFDPLAEVLSKGEYWRLLTPAFLHFGIAHLIFNSLWVWEVGRKLERLMGSLIWLAFAIFVSVVSNIGQYLMNGYPLFGGLSGLVYGLIAFAWVMPYLIKGWPAIISKPLMVFFVVWLIAGYTDVFSILGLGNMANEAHLMGLVSGLVFAGIYSLLWKLIKQR